MPENPLIVELDGPIWLKLRMTVPPLDAQDLLRWFTDPVRLARWMGDEHVVDLVPGGRYTIRWEKADRTMEGAVIVARPTELVFSWAFAHEPDAPARVVMVQTATADDGSGSTIVIVHGPYRSETEDEATGDAEAQERSGHLEGWQWFLAELRNQLAASPALT
ncbi:MAG: SRPBCC domain-containing protein [Thermomicrobiales bacterium]